LTAVAIVFVCRFYSPGDSTAESAPQSPNAPIDPMLFSPELAHDLSLGIKSPIAFSASEVAIADDSEVIGICVEGHARAYLLEAMSGGPTVHVINEVFGHRPISVTYCDLSGCSRVFAGSNSTEPLDFRVAGLRNGSLVLRVDDVLYAQSSKENIQRTGKIPYREWPHMRSTWKDWRMDHPDTDIYIGDVQIARKLAPKGH
jgi:hypothetical protein